LAETKAAEAKRAEEKKALEEKARKEAEEKRLADEKKAAEEKARKEAEAKKLAVAKAAEARRRAEEEKLRQARIENERSRAAELLSQGSGTTGTAAAGDGVAMATWGGQIKALVRDATTYSASAGSNPEARFRIRLTSPAGTGSADIRDCRVIEVQLTRSSGEQAWDRAAEQAIRKSSPWPRMPNGNCPAEAIELIQRPRD